MRAPHKVSDVLRLSLQSLARHPGRSALTALGVIFGVFSVIAMLAINEAASAKSEVLLRELGSDNIIVNAVKLTGQESSASGGGGRHSVLVYGITFEDVERLRTVRGIRRCVLAHRTQRIAYLDGTELPVEVIATEPDYATVARLDMTTGRFIVAADSAAREKHCVLTAALARKLFGPHDPLGRSLLLGGDVYRVVGVLARLPKAMQTGADAENTIIVPLVTHESVASLYTILRLPGSFRSEMAEVNQVILQMVNEAAVERAAPIVRRLLDKYHPHHDYRVQVPQELIEQQQKQARLWNITFAFIAGVSLLVGGIGIMNIMLASVTERTREIGVRRALGAKRRDIVAQFLTEAVMLTLVGGLLGIGLGQLVPTVVGRVLEDLDVSVSLLTMLLPFVMALVVGLVSGLYPALRAARLDPIEALRHE
ncbi:MAG: ABC transporter permease [Phycisphaerae bacterium]|nr:ABC transporter permease [Phycisphaerae bacterium]